jgi:hypothetical protein
MHVVAETKREARKIATLAHRIDPYAVVLVNDLAVSIFTARSQSNEAMQPKQHFEASKAAVLRECSKLCGAWIDYEGHGAPLVASPPVAPDRVDAGLDDEVSSEKVS